MDLLNHIASPKGFPPLELAFLLGAVELQPILKPHGHEPGFPIAPVEQCWQPIQHPITVPDSLFHGLPNIQLFNPLDLDVDARQTENIRNLPESERAATLTLIPGSRQKRSQLTLSSGTLAL